MTSGDLPYTRIVPHMMRWTKVELAAIELLRTIDQELYNTKPAELVTAREALRRALNERVDGDAPEPERPTDR